MFITDRQAAEIPALAELDTADRTQALADAERVHKFVRRNEFISDADLRAYGDRNDLDPDRMNLALEILKATGRLLEIPESA